MPFTEEQENAIKSALPDFYGQLAELQTQLAAQTALIASQSDLIEDLTERLEEVEKWRRALRLRIRTEGNL